MRGAVVVIDVLRAFTTAACAFAAGARDILLVSTVAEALALRDKFPRARLMGEIDGYPIDGFDFGNSPFEMTGQTLGGARLIQRTTAGTRAATMARGAQVILASSFVVAEATVQMLLRMQPSEVALVNSGGHRPHGGDDDRACAEYLAARLMGERPAPAPFVARVRGSAAATHFLDPSETAFPVEDLDLALEVDRYDFAMAGTWRDGVLVLERFGPAVD